MDVERASCPQLVKVLKNRAARKYHMNRIVSTLKTQYTTGVMATQKVFPSSFLWGAATSSHQVEGNTHNDWSEWEKLGKIAHGETSSRAAGHFERFRDDFSLAKKLGHNAHRLSLEWSRIEPRPGVIDQGVITHYREVLTELRRLDIEPIVTLWHFTNPIWVSQRGGWASRSTVDLYGRYVMAVVRELGDLVTHWITINEPTVYSSLSYVFGYWPPEKKNPLIAWNVIRNFASAHRLAYHIIHRHNPSAKVGAANNLSDFVPSRPSHLLDRGLTWLASYWHNQWWLDQTYMEQDFIGLNYYFYHPLRWKFSGLRNMFKPEPTAGATVSDVQWEIHPEGLGHLLEFLRRYDRPIIITENGLADATDSRREKFIRDHVQHIERALANHIRIDGYLHWSLLDNFEWREGFSPRFGLVAVDYGTLQRTPRPSAIAFRQIIQECSSR